MNKNYVCFIKFGEKKHMEALYNDGEIYMNTFDYFKKLEKSPDGRGDPDEYKLLHITGSGFKDTTIQIKSDCCGLAPTTLDKTALKSLSVDGGPREYSHLFCLSAVDIEWARQNKQFVDKKNVAETKDWFVCITNMNEFKNRLFRELEKQCEKIKSNFVEYVDKDNCFILFDCFKKFREYDYQNEWRVAAKFPNTQNSQTIKIGSLADIAMPPMYAPEVYAGRVEFSC